MKTKLKRCDCDCDEMNGLKVCGRCQAIEQIESLISPSNEKEAKK